MTIQGPNAIKPNVILTGFMGTGKTTIGKMLAKRLQYAFVDTDALIAQRAGKTVPEIFRTAGEETFRAMEMRVAQELAGMQGLVIATGGCLMLDPDNAETLGATGRVFCLVAAPEEILARISGDAASERPLLAGPNPMERILALMHKRQAGYRKFTQIITTGKTPEAVTQALIGIIRG